MLAVDMIRFTTTLSLLAVAPLAVSAGVPASPSYSLNLIKTLNVGIGGAEILSYSPDNFTLATTVNGGVKIYDFANPTAPTSRAMADFSASFNGTGANLNSVSSTALDPSQRGFGIVSLIPSNSGTTMGKIGFYDYADGAVLATYDVGFHPDSVLFSNDGSKAFVINEGEFTSGGDTDAPGSISVIDLGGVSHKTQVGALSVSTYDFSAGNLASGVSTSVLRFNDNTFSAGNEYRHIEPEYGTVVDGKVFVTLQENNGIAEFDIATNQWTEVKDLGIHDIVIDASDRDGGAFIDDAVKGVHMPDTIASFTLNGEIYLVTPGEGDFRVDDNDRKRVKSYAGGEGAAAGIDQSDSALGRLRVLDDLADPDGNGLINDVIIPGDRTVRIWKEDGSGKIVEVADLGNLGLHVLALDPTAFNSDAGDALEQGDPDLSGERDSRSDDKGAEPEGLDVLQTGNRILMAVGAERSNGIFLYDLTDPANPVLLDYTNSYAEGHASPESLLFVDAADSPTGQALLLVGYEVSGTIGVYAIPEPSSALALMGLFAGAAVALRRRR